MKRVMLRIIATLLILIGAGAALTSSAAFGDIGVAIAIGGIVGFLSGVGLWLVPYK